ncbi:MAG: AAA family ATPase [Chloroflexota bacterium]
MASEASTVLLICADRDSAVRLAAAIQPRGHRVIAAPFGPAALARAQTANAIVVDRIEGDLDAPRVVARIKDTPELAATPLLAIAQADDVEERVRLLEAGADDVVSRPVDPAELQLRLDVLLMRLPEAAPVAGGPSAPEERPAPPVVRDSRPLSSRVMAFMSPKGGAGTTTAAVNVAVTLARGGRSVALLDLHLTFGSVAMHLDIVPRFSIVDAVRDDLALDDPEVLKGYATLKDGITVLSAPATPDQRDLVSAEHVRRLLSICASAFEVTVIDLGSGFDERTLTAFGIADRVAILVTPEIPALRAVKALREALAEYEADRSRHVYVLNHVFPADMLLRDEVSKALGGVSLMELPYAQTIYHKAVITGVPVVTGAPRSDPADRLVKLGATLMGDPDNELLGGDGARKIRLTGLLRRG